MHCGCSANSPETLKAMLRMENEIKRARAKNGRAVLILIVEGTPANYVTFRIQSVSNFCTIIRVYKNFLHYRSSTSMKYQKIIDLVKESSLAQYSVWHLKKIHSHDLTRTCFPGMYWVLPWECFRPEGGIIRSVIARWSDCIGQDRDSHHLGKLSTIQVFYLKGKSGICTNIPNAQRVLF